jgi:hypothetical protein
MLLVKRHGAASWRVERAPAAEEALCGMRDLMSFS